MSTIRITPQELRDGAVYLGDRRDSIVNEVISLARKIDQVASTWEGAAQSSFIASFNEMLPILEKQFPEVITGIASQLEAAANAIETADLEVAKAFKG